MSDDCDLIISILDEKVYLAWDGVNDIVEKNINCIKELNLSVPIDISLGTKHYGPWYVKQSEPKAFEIIEEDFFSK
ncbi:hypothetical protein SAMN05720759_108180 [Fibrobacter sp. UWB12]|nr:hypothetical protein SAMN05720759_108180 [Fibrobacter sp. UWB12]